MDGLRPEGAPHDPVGARLRALLGHCGPVPWRILEAFSLGRLHGRIAQAASFLSSHCTGLLIVPHSFIHSFITRFPIRRSGALQQTIYGSPSARPVLGSLHNATPQEECPDRCATFIAAARLPQDLRQAVSRTQLWRSMENATFATFPACLFSGAAASVITQIFRTFRVMRWKVPTLRPTGCVKKESQPELWYTYICLVAESFTFSALV